MPSTQHSVSTLMSITSTLKVLKVELIKSVNFVGLFFNFLLISMLINCHYLFFQWAKKLSIIYLLFSFSCTQVSPQFTGTSQEFEMIDNQIKKSIVPYQIDNQVEDEIHQLQLPKFFRAEDTKYFQLHHTQLQVSFNWEKQYVNGMATLTLSPFYYPQDSIVLDAKGFDIHQTTLLKNEQSTKLPYKYNQKKLTLYLPMTYTQKDTFQVFIKYTAKPNELEETIGGAIKSDKGLFFY